ncbi:hypothetical protein GEMRC1_006464 [Eukaryota sp. GEM-RC1]
MIQSFRNRSSAIPSLFNTLSSNRIVTHIKERNIDNALNELQSNAQTLKFLPKDPIEATRDAASRLSIDLQKIPAVHIAGTKGKGSTSFVTEQLLRSSNPSLKTLLFTSPHILNVRERIRINGQPISRDLFKKYFWKVFDTLASSTDDSRYPTMPPYFRFLTVLALKISHDEKIPINVFEVGIGGTLDSTNVIHPTVCGITSMGIDHQNVLGNTLSQITEHKAGIIKENIPVVTVLNPLEAMKVIEDTARRKNAPLRIARTLPKKVSSVLKHVPFVQTNTALGVELADAFRVRQLGQQSWFKDDELILPAKAIKAIKNLSLPGRHQVLYSNNNRIFLDGAHTTDSLAHTGSWFRRRSKPSKSSILIFNVTGDRNPATLLTALNLAGHFSRAIFVDKDCASEWLKLGGSNSISICPSVKDAVRSALLSPGDVLVTGSFQLCGDVLRELGLCAV